MVTKADLRRVALWKADRVLHVSDHLMKKLNRLASIPNLHVTDAAAKDVISALVSSEGIGFPMASAILKFIRPDVFPIVDVRAYRALTGKRAYYSTYTYEKYAEYALALKDIAALTGRPLREIDEQLYSFDEKHNGKI